MHWHSLPFAQDEQCGSRQTKHLAKHPNAVVVLHRADRAPTERLYDLEDAFETPHLQHDGVLVKSSGAGFILQTSLGSALTSHICGDRACEAHHKTDLIRYVKEQSQLHWTRQAKLDPEYARPITAHTLMFLIGMPVFAGRGLRPL